MINKLIRYYNQNRKKVFIIIIAVAFFLIILRLANYLVAISKENQELTDNSMDEIVSTIPNETTSDRVYSSNQKYNITVKSEIEQFINLCNNREVQKAYDLLGEKCKEEIYQNDINNFINNYYKNIFSTRKTYKVEEWMEKNGLISYRVIFSEDNLLATGGKVTSGNNYEDIMTVVIENNERKVNVNNFIIKQELNKSITSNGIEILINSIEKYKDYEIYNVNIKNNSAQTICLSTSKNDEDICLYDENNVKYKSYMHEIPTDLLTIQHGHQKQFQIKFGKIYNNSKKTSNIEFANIVTDIEREKLDRISIYVAVDI